MNIDEVLVQLKDQLEIKVKGKVYVTYNTSNIDVKIVNSDYSLWITSIPLLYARVSVKKIVSELTQLILTQYKEDILNKYFIK